MKKNRISPLVLFLSFCACQKEEVEKEFGRKFTNKFNIHRTIRGFPSDGIDTFENMAQTRVFVVDRMVQKRLGGGLNLETNEWYFPKPTRPIQEAKLETN